MLCVYTYHICMCVFMCVIQSNKINIKGNITHIRNLNKTNSKILVSFIRSMPLPSKTRHSKIQKSFQPQSLKDSLIYFLLRVLSVIYQSLSKIEFQKQMMKLFHLIFICVENQMHHHILQNSQLSLLICNDTIVRHQVLTQAWTCW